MTPPMPFCIRPSATRCARRALGNTPLLTKLRSTIRRNDIISSIVRSSAFGMRSKRSSLGWRKTTPIFRERAQERVPAEPIDLFLHETSPHAYGRCIVARALTGSPQPNGFHILRRRGLRAWRLRKQTPCSRDLGIHVDREAAAERRVKACSASSPSVAFHEGGLHGQPHHQHNGHVPAPLHS